MKVLVTGAAGFVGFYVVQKLISNQVEVVGLDNVNDYYDVALKESRLQKLNALDGFEFVKLDLADGNSIRDLFVAQKFEQVIHLGAQAGVRYSIENPTAYSDSNLIGHLNILEACRHNQVEHLIYASSSSVYGLNNKTPFSTKDSVDHPVSLYAATKKANELMSHTYSHLYGLPTTGLRFFTVYGPWGRPDMAYFKFTKAILNGDSIDVYNNGNLSRDFTYIDDIVEGVVRIANVIPSKDKSWTVENGDPASSSAPYAIYNIGNGSPVNLMEFIRCIESELGIEAKKNYLPMQMGDVYTTYADVESLFNTIDYKPKTNINDGVANFINWYKEFYRV